jgi:hypothetical protein
MFVLPIFWEAWTQFFWLHFLCFCLPCLFHNFFLLLPLFLVRSLSLLVFCTFQPYYLTACRCSCTVIWQQINRLPVGCVWRKFNETGNRLNRYTVACYIHWHTYMATCLSGRCVIFIVRVRPNSGAISCWMILMIHKSHRGDPSGAWVNGFWHYRNTEAGCLEPGAGEDNLAARERKWQEVGEKLHNEEQRLLIALFYWGDVIWGWDGRNTWNACQKIGVSVQGFRGQTRRFSWANPKKRTSSKT